MILCRHGMALVMIASIGCYRSHTPGDGGIAEGGTDRNTQCRNSAECDDGLQCTSDVCVANACTHEPIPLSFQAEYPIGSVAGSAPYMDRAAVLTYGTRYEAHVVGLDGPGAERYFLARNPNAGGVWPAHFATLASRNTELYFLGMDQGQSHLWWSDGTRSFPTLAFPRLEVVGDELVALGDNCQTLWFDARFEPGLLSDARCPHSQIGGEGTPPQTRPAQIRPGEITIYYSAAGTNIIELNIARDGVIQTQYALMDIGTGGLRGFSAQDIGSGELIAQWVRKEAGAEAAEIHMARLGRRGTSLVPLAPILVRPDPQGESYGIRMDTILCEGRALLLNIRNNSFVVEQLLLDGTHLGTVELTPEPQPRFGIANLECISGGAIVAGPSRVHVLACAP